MRLNESRGQSSVAGSQHLPIQISFQVIVQHRGTTRRARYPQQRETKTKDRIEAPCAKKKTKRRRYQHQRKNSRLGKFPIEPNVLHLTSSDSRLKWLEGSWQTIVMIAGTQRLFISLKTKVPDTASPHFVFREFGESYCH